MATEPSDSQPIDTVRFRPSKKRKVFRSRTNDEDDEDEKPAESDQRVRPPSAHDARAVASDFFGQDEADETAAQPSTVAAALRHRSVRRGRLQGVGFGSRPLHAGSASDERGIVLRQQHPSDDGAVAPVGMASRFTQQTGLITDSDDKHMNEYIESHMSSRPAQRAPPTPNTQQQDEEDEPADPSHPANRAPGQPVMQGKLMEVDLTSHPIIRGGIPEDRPARDSKRSRLGPDGKPWRSRKRRGSDDVKRDQLVEEFLSENRLDVYDVADTSTKGPEADGEADERLAEEFRRQFLDDVARRRQQQQMRKKKPTQAAKPGSEDVLRGPKLGGSRNQRAAVRDILLKKEKEAKK